MENLESDPSLDQVLDSGDFDRLLDFSAALGGSPLQVVSLTGSTRSSAGASRSGAGRCDCLRTLIERNCAVNSAMESGAVHSCRPGVEALVFELEHSHQRIGYLIVGPYDISAGSGPARRARAIQLAEQLRLVIELLVESARRVATTSEMHSTLMAENFRTLDAKNQELQALFESSRELERLKRNLLASVSHELKTPLSAILGLSQLLGDQAPDTPADEQLALIRRIGASGERLSALVDDLITMSEFEAGSLVIDKRPVDVRALTSTLEHTFHQRGLPRRIDVGVDVAVGVSIIWADPARLRQALTHLFDNALKFTPDGGRITLSVRCDVARVAPAVPTVLTPAEPEVMEFRVADTGIGIPEADRRRVFEPFHQVDSDAERRQGGIGLGLSVTHRIALAHQGSITVEDNAPHGTVFVLRIPVTSDAASPSDP